MCGLVMRTAKETSRVVVVNTTKQTRSKTYEQGAYTNIFAVEGPGAYNPGVYNFETKRKAIKKTIVRRVHKSFALEGTECLISRLHPLPPKDGCLKHHEADRSRPYEKGNS